MSRKPASEWKPNSIPSKHKWEDDKCAKCGLVRKGSALSANLIPSRWPGGYFYTYLVEGEWVEGRPDCTIQNSK